MRKKTIKNISIVLIGTLLSKILGVIRELVVSYKFGASELTDAFVLTNSIPNILFSAIAMAVSINFIPVYLGIANKERKSLFTSRLINIYLIILSIGCAIMILCPRFFLLFFATGLKETTRDYATVMLRVVAISGIPIVLAGIFQAYCQAEQSFNAIAVYGVIINIITIIVTCFSSESRYYILSIATVAANIVGCLYVSCKAKKIGYHYYLSFTIKDEYLKELCLLTLPLVLENIASNLSVIVDKNLASFLDRGTIAALGYANTIGAIPNSVVSSAIIAVVFSESSELYSENKIEEFTCYFVKCARVIVYLLAPMSVFMMFASETISRVIFERGAFDSNATMLVAECLMFYSIGIIFSGLQTFIVRGFYAMKETKVPVNVMIFSLLCNMAGNFILVNWIKHKGIALSTSLSYLMAVELLLTLLKKKGINVLKIINTELIKSMIVSFIVGLLSFGLIQHSGNILMSKDILSLVIHVVIYSVGYIFIQSVIDTDFRKYCLLLIGKIKENVLQ